MDSFYKASFNGYIAACEGITRKTMVSGEKTLMSAFNLRSGSVLQAHSHLEEQTGYLVSGHMFLTIGNTEYDVYPGDAWVIAGGTVHSAKIPEDSVAVEVFAPVRKDYLP